MASDFDLVEGMPNLSRPELIPDIFRIKHLIERSNLYSQAFYL